jgi:BASS family bile acid:Na+ symporter
MVTLIVNVSPAMANCLKGLAIIIVMPAAASSPAWTQNAGGNIVTALGIVIVTTLASPLLAAASSQIMNRFLNFGGAIDEHVIVGGEYLAFSFFWLIVPTFLGFCVRSRIRGPARQHVLPWIRIANSMCLLLLIYAFAAVEFHKIVLERNTALLFVVGGLTGFICLSAFGTGYLVGRLARVPMEQRVAIIFSTGMFNNGIALLMGTILVTDNSAVFLPMIVYAMFQHLLAAITVMIVGDSAEPSTILEGV